jgi:hypothetical protein
MYICIYTDVKAWPDVSEAKSENTLPAHYVMASCEGVGSSTVDI